MRTLIVGVFVSAALAAGLMWMAGSGEDADAGAASVDFAGVDMFGFDNACNSLGATDSARSNVPLNQPFTVDVVVKGVPAGPAPTRRPRTAAGSSGQASSSSMIANRCSCHRCFRRRKTCSISECGLPSPFDVFDPFPDTDGSFRADSIDLRASRGQETARRLCVYHSRMPRGGDSQHRLHRHNTGGGDVPGVLGDSGATLYTVDQEGNGQIGCDTDLGVTPPPTPTPCQTNCPTPTVPTGHPAPDGRPGLRRRGRGD